MQCTESSSSGVSAVVARTSRGYTAGTCALVLVTALVACSGEPPTGAGPMLTPSALRASVTGLAAEAIGPNGQIRLAASPADEHELTASQALSFASAWTRDYAPMTRGWLERTHGAAIDFKTLRNCGRPLYARSAISPPPNSIPGPYRRVYGPWWLITFCDNAGFPTVSVAVSGWTELTIHAGKLQFPRISGTDFVAVGVPLGHVGEYPMPPELAVQIASQQAGKRVAKVPDLVMPLPDDGPPQLARWRLTFENPVTARTKSTERTTDHVYVGPTVVGGPEVATSIAALLQPEAIDLHWTSVPRVGETRAAYFARATHQTTKILRHADTPVRVERISAWGTNP